MSIDMHPQNRLIISLPLLLPLLFASCSSNPHPDPVDHFTAEGSYQYDEEAGTLSWDITSSTFPSDCGLSVGIEEFTAVVTDTNLFVTSITNPGEDLPPFHRDPPGTPGDITGTWHLVEASSGTYEVIFDVDGSTFTVNGFDITCEGTEAPDAVDRLPLCPDEPMLSVIPLAEADYDSINPIGLVGAPAHVLATDHGAFIIHQDPDAGGGWLPPVSAAILAPSDGTVTQLEKFSISSYGGTVTFSDYAIEFSPCREVRLKFAHMQAMSSTLQAQATSWDRCDEVDRPMYSEIFTYCYKAVDEPIAAGERLGTAGSAGGRALDFGAWDARITPLDFINPDRYEPDIRHHFDYLHVVCPLDLFEPSLSQALHSKVGQLDQDHKLTPRTVPPVCGETMLDVPGTLRGHWFKEGSTDNGDWEVHLAFAYDLMDPTVAVYARGQTGTLQNISFTPNSTGYINREFIEVTADGNIYCYEPNWVDQRILVRMDSSVTLTLEDQLGTVCADGGFAFSGSEVVYER